jgi:MFS family permease
MIRPPVNDASGPISPARRLGGIALAPGYLPRHAVTYLYAAFITIGLFAFVSYMQPYLLTVNLALPAQLQGRTISALNIANELLALCLVAPFGALADKIGRRPVYTFGLAWLAAGFLLYPTARTLPQLAGCALFFSVGVAAIGTMLGTVLADTSRDLEQRLWCSRSARHQSAWPTWASINSPPGESRCGWRPPCVPCRRWLCSPD